MKKNWSLALAFVFLAASLSACADNAYTELDATEMSAQMEQNAQTEESATPESTEAVDLVEATPESISIDLDSIEVSVKKEYHLKLKYDDPFDIVYTDRYVRVKYKMQSPELRSQSMYEEVEGEFVLMDDYFIDSMEAVLDELQDLTESGIYGRRQLELIDYGYRMFQFLSKSQNRTDDMSLLYGETFYNVYGKEMDYNSDGKVTVDECYAYFAGELVPSLQLLEDHRGELSEAQLAKWKAKGLIPAKTQTGSFKTQEPVNAIVLNGETYYLMEDTVKKFVDNGFVLDGAQLTDTVRGGGFLYGHFEGGEENDVSLYYHTVNGYEGTVEVCVIDQIRCRVPSKDAALYSWKCGSLTIDGNTLKEEALPYFDLDEYGENLVRLYMPDFVVEFYCTNLRRDSTSASSYFDMRAFPYDSYSTTEPEWVE